MPLDSEDIIPWNNPKILPPPVYTSTYSGSFDLDQLSHTCSNIIDILCKQSPLHKESAIVSRVLYKFDKKFRNDIGYRTIKKVNVALHKYLKINFLKVIENFSSTLPSQHDDKYVPTRQMLQYVLIRLLTFAKLMIRIYVCSKQAAIFYLDRIKRGESHWMSLMPYALLCRVWSISNVLLQHSSDWYHNLLQFHDKLPLTGMNFLPNNYKLPLNLKTWLDFENLDGMGRFEWCSKKCVEIKMNLELFEDYNSSGTLDSILKYVNEINNETPAEEDIDVKLNPKEIATEDSTAIKLNNVLNNVDQGQVVSRDTFKNFSSSFTAKSERGHCTNVVTNKKSLKKFMATEEELRSKNSVDSLTSHLSFMQWQALKTAIVKLNSNLNSSRKIERKFEKIWKEKCLDYK